MVLTPGKLTIRLWEYEYGKSETTSTLAFSLLSDSFWPSKKNESIQKHSQKWRHLKTQAYRFTVDGRKWSLLKTH